MKTPIRGTANPYDEHDARNGTNSEQVQTIRELIQAQHDQFRNMLEHQQLAFNSSLKHFWDQLEQHQKQQQLGVTGAVGGQDITQVGISKLIVKFQDSLDESVLQHRRATSDAVVETIGPILARLEQSASTSMAERPPQPPQNWPCPGGATAPTADSMHSPGFGTIDSTLSDFHRLQQVLQQPAANNPSDVNPWTSKPTVSQQMHCNQVDMNPAAKNTRSSTDAGKRLRKAAGNNQADLLHEELAGGADIAGSDGGGKTALHYAARAGALETGRMLLELKADPNAPDNYGSRPVDEAQYWAVKPVPGDDGLLRINCLAMLKLLQEHGGKCSNPLETPNGKQRLQQLEEIAKKRGVEVPSYHVNGASQRLGS